LGYDLGDRPPDQSLELTLYWQSLRELDQDYTVFVHLLDPATGQIVAQVDEGPQHGDDPTSLWVEGEVVADPHVLDLPAALPAGAYTLRVGLYLQDAGTYLWVNGEVGLLLAEIEVGP
jgi:hypothetical protein